MYTYIRQNRLFKTKTVRSQKEGYYIMINASNQDKDVSF